MQEIIIIITGIVVLAVLARKVYRIFTKPTGAGCNCDGCDKRIQCPTHKTPAN